MLIKGDKTISEVAYEVGFTAPSYFTKCFKGAIEAVKFKARIKEIIDNSHNRIMELYGSLIIEGYADIFEDIKREVEKCEDAG